MSDIERTLRRRAIPITLIFMLVLVVFYLAHRFIIDPRQRDQVVAPEPAAEERTPTP